MNIKTIKLKGLVTLFKVIYLSIAIPLTWFKYEHKNHKIKPRSVSLKELSLCHKLKILLPISLQSNYVNLKYFKLWLFDLIQSIVWNIKSLRNWVAKIKELEYQSLCQRLKSFANEMLFYPSPLTLSHFSLNFYFF